MPIVRFDPFKSLFNEEFPGTAFSNKGLKIHETDKSLVVEAVVAGVPKKDVEIEIEDGVLTIKAESKSESKADDYYKSSNYQYYYTTALSGGQWDKAEAEVNDGVVKIEIPKTEAARPRKITIKSK